MKDSDTGADSRSTKHLQSIDRRLFALERQTGNIMHVASAGLYQSWRRRLRPRLWIPHQYSSRRIRVPPQYRREQPPDDAPVLLPGTLAYVARAFRDNPDLDVVYGHRVYIDFHGFEIGRCVLPPHDAEILKWADYIPQETLFWRRRVWEKIGPFDESFKFALDWDFVIRAQTAGFAFRRLPRFLACFRIHNQQKNTYMGIWESGRCIGSGRGVSLRLPVNTR